MAFKWADPNRVMDHIEKWGRELKFGTWTEHVAQMAIEKINILEVHNYFCPIDKRFYTSYIVEWQDFDGKWHKMPYTTDKNEIEAIGPLVDTVRSVRRDWIDLVGYHNEFHD